MKRVLLVLAVACSACAGAKGPAPEPAAPVETTPPVWPAYELATTGLVVRMPAEPRELAGTLGAPEDPTYFSALEAKHDDLVLSAGRVRLYEGRPRLLDEAALERSSALVSNVTQKEQVAHGSYRGLELLGTTPDGDKARLARIFIIGHSVVYLTVDAPPGKLDDALARRMFDSLELEIPWTLAPVPEARVSFAIPAYAAEVPAGQLDEGTVGRVYFMGGRDDLTYTVVFTPVDPTVLAEASTDALLDRVIAAYSGEGRVVWSSAKEHLGARGRDVLIEKDETQMRVRVVVHDDRLYQLIVSANARGPLMSDDTKAFFESLRWF